MPKTTIVGTSMNDLIEKIIALRFLGAFLKSKFLGDAKVERTERADALMTLEAIRTQLAPYISSTRYERIKATMHYIVDRWAMHNTILGFTEDVKPKRFLKILFGEACIREDGTLDKRNNHLYAHILQEDHFKALFQDLPDCYSYGKDLLFKYAPENAERQRNRYITTQCPPYSF
jgi:hypothetical protein